MTKLKKFDVHDFKTSKFIRQHVVNFYDVLHRHKFFETIVIIDFFERQIFKLIQYKKRVKMNINNDFDVSLDEYEMQKLNDDKQNLITNLLHEKIIVNVDAKK